MNKNKRIEIKFENEFKKTFLNLKVNKYKNIFITSDLSKIGPIEIPIKRKLEIIFKSLKKVIGKNYSIFCPGMSLSLMKNTQTFNVKKTFAENVGRFPNFILKQKKSNRNIHPFWSIIGIGKKSNLLKTKTINCFGYSSPWTDLIGLNTLQVHLDVEPYKSISLIHYLETIMGVPYRFNKSFKKNVIINGNKKNLEFIYPVRYKNLKNSKDKSKNKILFRKLNNSKKINFYKNNFNQKCWSFLMKDFFVIAKKHLNEDNYFLLKKKPNLQFLNNN